MSKKTKQKYQYYLYILQEGDKREHILCQINISIRLVVCNLI